MGGTSSGTRSAVFPGAVDLGDGRVTFALYAPGKKSVHLIGDFNNWDAEADPMKPTEAGLWRCERKLGPGAYRYQFLVDHTLTICDPYARALSGQDRRDPSRLPRAVVEVGRRPYPWRHDDWSRPGFADLIIYELHVGDFSPEGNFQGVAARLDYLKDLGVNAIELMPIFEFPGTIGWGYAPSCVFAIERKYGTPDDLRDLVDEAHARGIAVLLDIVLAHTAHEHPFNALYPYDQSPWYGRGFEGGNQFGLPTFDPAKAPARDFIRDVQAYWLTEFRIDGFRYDYLRAVGSREGLGVPFLVRSAREFRPDAFLIGEELPEDPREISASGLDGAWHAYSGYALKALLRQAEFKGFHGADLARALGTLDAAAQGYARPSMMVNYLESHDDRRALLDLREGGIDEETARRKLALGATLLLAAPGVPMLYHGQEWGEATEINHDQNPLHWELLATPGGRGLFEHHQRLCRLRREHPALRSPSWALDALWADRACFVAHRWTDQGDEVVLAANFSAAGQRVCIPFPRPGNWRELFSGADLQVENCLESDLDPWSAKIFTRP